MLRVFEKYLARNYLPSDLTVTQVENAQEGNASMILFKGSFPTMQKPTNANQLTGFCMARALTGLKVAMYSGRKQFVPPFLMGGEPSLEYIRMGEGKDENFSC